jgi:hypothetical protein
MSTEYRIERNALDGSGWKTVVGPYVVWNENLLGAMDAVIKGQRERCAIRMVRYTNDEVAGPRWAGPATVVVVPEDAPPPPAFRRGFVSAGYRPGMRGGPCSCECNSGGFCGGCGHGGCGGR